MPDEPNIPDVTQSWRNFIERLILVLSLLLNFYNGVVSSWNNVKLHGVQDHQEISSVKLDAVKATAEEVKSTTDTVKKDVKAIAPK